MLSFHDRTSFQETFARVLSCVPDCSLVAGRRCLVKGSAYDLVAIFRMVQLWLLLGDDSGARRMALGRLGLLEY